MIMTKGHPLFRQETLIPWGIAMLVLLSRIPFLWNGYGTEEDSWGLVINAWDIANSGHYVYSRLPGHPLQELLLAAFPHAGPFVYNLFSALFSAVAIFFFAKILQWYQVRLYWLGALALAFTPVFYISSTYTIDYCYALAFILAAYYSLLKGRMWVAGVLLGMAVGSRLTSAMMLLPFVMILWGSAKEHRIKNILILSLTTGLSALLAYAPAFYEYGLAVIGTYKLPYPPLAKALYKGSIGVWGVLGGLALLLAVVASVWNHQKNNGVMWGDSAKKSHQWSWMVAVLLPLLIFVNLPEKSAFLIPALPFVILLLARFVKMQWIFITFCILTILSSFVLSVNISDSKRGADFSSHALFFNMAGQEIFADPLNGPIFSDYTKRANKAAFCSETLATIDTMGHPAILIAGWWHNELVVEMKESGQECDVQLRAHVSEDSLQYFKQANVNLFYLPEINVINNRRYGKDFTEQYAEPIINNGSNQKR